MNKIKPAQMTDVCDLFIHDVVNNYSAYSIPIWQPKRIEHAISLLSEEIAKKLDYSDPMKCVKSIGKELDIDITQSLVKNKFPVWVDLSNSETSTPVNRNAVITYIENVTDDVKPLIDRMESYAKKVSADFVLLTGRTQGYVELEKHRIEAFAELYDKILYVDTNVFIKDDCPNLFEIVPDKCVGITDDKNIPSLRIMDDKKIYLLKADAFSRSQGITLLHEHSIRDELEIMNTCYDNSVVLCSKENADIWKPFTFPFRFTGNENKAWMEILIYRNGHIPFILDEKFNFPIVIANESNNIEDTKIIRYQDHSKDPDVVNVWYNDNNIVGYKEKDPVDMSKFNILSLYHKDEQIESIQKRDYLQFVNLNDMESKFDNSFTESRIYYQNFDQLFPEEFEYVGLTTGSWNLKYVGINPIDQLHNWPAIRSLDENTVLCADTETTSRFFRERKSVLHNVFNEITLDLIKEFLQLINLPIEYEEKRAPVSNQIIAKRSIVKSLFDFYQSNEILDKIAFFIDKHQLTVKEGAYGGDAFRRRSGFFAETATALWLNHNNFTIMPQEILKRTWYK